MYFVKDLTVAEYAPFYQGYIEKAGDLDLLTTLKESFNSTYAFFDSIPESQYDSRYLPEKWSIKEVFQHMLDTERIFAYRALRFSRSDKAALSGFDENEYVPESFTHLRSKTSLLKEYSVLRQSTQLLFESFAEEALTRLGTASNAAMSVRAVGFVIAGHEQHHCKVVKERYL